MDGFMHRTNYPYATYCSLSYKILSRKCFFLLVLLIFSVKLIYFHHESFTRLQDIYMILGLSEGVHGLPGDTTQPSPQIKP